MFCTYVVVDEMSISFTKFRSHTVVQQTSVKYEGCRDPLNSRKRSGSAMLNFLQISLFQKQTISGVGL